MDTMIAPPVTSALAFPLSPDANPAQAYLAGLKEGCYRRNTPSRGKFNDVHAELRFVLYC
jgi:hypothetical protein